MTTAPSRIAPRDAATRATAGCPLIDVRTPLEYATVHAVGAITHPLDRLDPLALPADDAARPLLLLCKGGTRAGQAAERLLAAGRSHLLVVEGGTDAWAAAGLPVVRNRAVISLERQVRIAAGTLVAIGTAVGFWVHPLGLLLAGFVGLGLVFAGITDTCGMGLLLARAPWNRRAAEAAAEKPTTPSCCG